MKTIIAVLTILGFAFGAWFFIDGRYALSQELEKTKARLEYKIISDQFMAIQERIWKIDDRHPDKKMDATTKEEIRTLELKQKELNEKMKTLEGK